MEEQGDDTLHDFSDYSIVLNENDFSVASQNGDALTQSQYAKVVFRDIADSYPTDADVSCRYTLNSEMDMEEGYVVALFEVGWTSVDEALISHPAFLPCDTSLDEGCTTGQVTFLAEALPKDEERFFQLCFLTQQGVICGASVPFQFHRPHASELCAVDEAEMVVVRSRTAIAEERLRQAIHEREEAMRERRAQSREMKDVLELLQGAQADIDLLAREKADLINENMELREALENMRQNERLVNKLKQENLALDEGNHQTNLKLRHAQQQLDMLTSTVETLSADKARMSGLLRENVLRADELAAQLEEVHAALGESNELMTRGAAQHVEQLNEVRRKYLLRLIEGEKRGQAQEAAAKESEEKLRQEVTHLRLRVQEHKVDILRRDQDLNLLREQRSNLETCLKEAEQNLAAQKRDMATSMQRRVYDAETKYNELLAKHNAQNLAMAGKISQLSQKACGRGCARAECQQCEGAAVQLSLMDAQVKDLRDRLEQGAHEYRKLYVRLERLRRSSSKVEPPPVHQARSTAAAPKNHCEQCSASFADAKTLQIHLEGHKLTKN